MDIYSYVVITGYSNIFNGNILGWLVFLSPSIEGLILAPIGQILDYF
jgi:hypothetical protein